MLKEFKHYFIPHPETHQKAKLLSWHFFIIYILIFILLRVSVDLVNIYKPGVLGVDSQISVEKIIEETNKERQKHNLPLVTYNQSLSEAAAAKANNMFEENYWAHYSPSGKDPWSFINASGYKFSYAGENLAKNFSTSEDVVKAWMESPKHRENILSSNYDDIGIAISEGVLQGQKTTLVVQMFGRPYSAVAVVKPEVSAGGEKSVIQTQDLLPSKPVVVAGTQTTPAAATVDPYVVMKTAGLGLMGLIALLLCIDWVVLKRRGVFRISTHHVAHLSFIGLVGSSVIFQKVGEIL